MCGQNCAEQIRRSQLLYDLINFRLVALLGVLRVNFWADGQRKDHEGVLAAEAGLLLPFLCLLHLHDSNVLLKNKKILNWLL